MTDYNELFPAEVRMLNGKAFRDKTEWVGETCGIEMTYQWINTTGRTITVVNMDNSRFEVRPTMPNHQSTVTRGRFVQRRIYDISPNVTKGIYDFLMSISEGRKLGKILIAFRDEFLRQYRLGFRENIQFVLDVVVLASSLKECDDHFVPVLNVMLSTKPIQASGDHILSEETIVEQRIDELVKDYNNATSISLTIVDNDNKVGDRWFFAMKDVHRVKAVKDPLRASGLYITYHQKEGGIRTHIKEDYCTFEKMEAEFGLFRTPDEAKSGGDPKLLRAAEVEDLKHQKLKVEHDLDRERNEWVREKMQAEHKLERERNEWVRETEMLRAQLNERKMLRDDVYHSKETERKTWSEGVKMFITAFSGVLSLVTLGVTWMSRNKSS